ncbi:hypothetical protein PspLS_00312 [Pyricularia sp. CBS 133598]|nr:hypothetical protein PspLS_00312 [Pyricularia sp. CBS 133598]
MSRAIDKFPDSGRRREKKVLVTATSRTGTFSLYQALNMLGYRTYHAYEMCKSGEHHIDCYNEALKAKYLGIGKPYGKAEFDKWLGDYDAIVEIAAFFVEELTEFYPEATIIHVERDTDKWYTSVVNTVGQMINDCAVFPLHQVRLVDPFINSFCKHHMIFDQVIHWSKGPKACKEYYDETNRRVRQLVPKEKLAVFRLEDGFGWEQICPHLGKPIPDRPYPIGNAPVQFKELARTELNPKIAAGLIKLAMVALVPTAVTGILLYVWW